MKRAVTSFLGCAAVLLGGLTLAPDTATAKKKKPPVWTIEWDVQAFDDNGRPTTCSGMDDECTVKYSLIVRLGSVRVGTYFTGKESMKSFIIGTWGKCTGKNKRRGMICGMLNHDCGDGCYADVVAVKVRKKRLVIDKYEGCQGGQDCTEKPKQVFSLPIGNARIKARK